MRQWKEIGVGFENEPIRFAGVNVWNHKWVPMDESVELPHPAHPTQIHKMFVYEIETAGRTITFAAGELSAGVWGFYAAV